MLAHPLGVPLQKKQVVGVNRVGVVIFFTFIFGFFGFNNNQMFIIITASTLFSYAHKCSKSRDFGYHNC